MTDTLEELRVGDLSTVLAVRRAGSVTGAARDLRVSPSQVSKAIARVEAALHLTLLVRRGRGIALTDAAARVLPRVEDAVARLQAIPSADARPAPRLTIAAPSYLLHAVLPRVARAMSDVRLRGLELPPSLVRSFAGDGLFDMTLLPGGAARFPASWAAEAIGELRKGLFATPALARRLGRAPVAPEALRDVPFVQPIHLADGKLPPVDDDCPLAHAARVVGHEAQTIGMALDLAAASEQLVFGPVLAARAHLRAGALVAIDVRGWDVRETVFLVCDADAVRVRERAAVMRAVREAIAEEAPLVEEAGLAREVSAPPGDRTGRAARRSGRR